MLKWVTALCLMMYATLMIFGGEGYTAKKDIASAEAPEVVETDLQLAAVVAQTPSTSPPAKIVAEAETAPSQPTSVVGALAQPSVVQSSIAPIAPVAEPAAPTPTNVAVETAAPQPAAPSERLIYTVTGSRVNLRTAANAQAEILGRTVRGETAEVIELLSNGWARVYIIDTGIEAFMSAQFIEPAR